MAAAKKNTYWIPANAGLTTVIPRFAPAQRWNEYRVWDVWEKVVDEALARKACPTRIHNGTLFVMVSNSVLIQELQFAKAILREQLNRQIGAPVVRDIRFVIGRVSERALRPSIPIQRPLPVYSEIPMPHMSRPELEAAFSSLLEARRKRLLQKGEHGGGVTVRESSETM